MAGSKRNASRSVFRKPLVIVTIVAAVLLFFGTFFQVSEIEVKGASTYSAQEIIQASRIEKGDGLFLLNRVKSASYIFAKLPNIEEVNISTKFPGKVVIQVQETAMIAYIEKDGTAWGIDPNGTILAELAEDEVGELIVVSGLELKDPEAEKRLEDVCTDSAAVTALCGILNAVNERGIASEISAMDCKDPGMPKLTYGNFTIILDASEEFNHQLALVQNAVSQLGESEKGTLDLTIDQRVHYRPAK